MTARKSIMLGTAGHVDHGKTALVRMLTGCETDTLAEEQQRGLTIDLGFAPCRLADKRIVGVVDVPGHVDFIRNMVAGAHGIDVVIFVVAADDGIMPQTHEHLHILTLMGLKHGLVALTKIDLVDSGRREAVIAGLRNLLAGTFLENAPICPLSNMTGEGLDPFFDTLNAVVNACEERSCGGVFRVWVEDVFTIRGSGTVITGIPASGTIRPGNSVQLLPAGIQGRVRRMQVYGEDATEGRAGECVALNVPELDHTLVKRGMLLGESGAPPPAAMAEAEFRVLDTIKETMPDYFEAYLHVGTAAALTRVAMLDTTAMAAGQRQFVQLRLTEPLPLAPGERFVVRANVASAGQSGWTTIGGGRIVGVSNTRLRRHKQWTLDGLSARLAAIDDPSRWAELMLSEADQPLALREAARLCGLHEAEAALLFERLKTSGAAVGVNDGFLHSAKIREVGARICGLIQEFHKANPQRTGIAREELASAAGLNPDLFQQAVQSLIESRQIEWNNAVYAQANWKVRTSSQEEQIAERVAAAYQKAGLTSPSADELAASLRLAPGQVDRAIRLLRERGVLVRLDDRISMHREAIERAKQIALQLFTRHSSFTTMDFRDALEVSRKFAVPLLDHLDRLRITVRSGNNRTPGAEAKKALEQKPVTH